MKNAFFLLAVCAGLLLTGCASFTAQRRIPVPPQMTDAQEAELRHRLDQLYVGMGRNKALGILNMDSFNLPVYVDSNSSGITYSFPKKHVLTISTLPGDYDYTIQWVRFDNELWPQNNEKKKTPPLVDHSSHIIR